MAAKGGVSQEILGYGSGSGWRWFRLVCSTGGKPARTVLWSEVARGGEASGARARAGVPCSIGWHGHAKVDVGMGVALPFGTCKGVAWALRVSLVDYLASTPRPWP